MPIEAHPALLSSEEESQSCFVCKRVLHESSKREGNDRDSKRE